MTYRTGSHLQHHLAWCYLEKRQCLHFYSPFKYLSVWQSCQKFPPFVPICRTVKSPENWQPCGYMSLFFCDRSNLVMQSMACSFFASPYCLPACLSSQSPATRSSSFSCHWWFPSTSRCLCRRGLFQRIRVLIMSIYRVLHGFRLFFLQVSYWHFVL